MFLGALAAVAVVGACHRTARAPGPPEVALASERVREPPLTREDIRQIALHTAARRGYQHCEVEHLIRAEAQWEIQLEGHLDGRATEIEMWIDGWDGRVLKVWEDDRADPL